ncbi:hypothetical protein JOD45_000625 [Scopulibacillus daqui]|uniref:Uncharacterized protein n=1 Tax=Scopulibacillus daqui TaxID=1469162 RepID=A0ABS2PWK8_9BACL|nr:hypothetical protein [Scopulibacillus daqui]MBM7644432.1 hypothetical protein [Scopulibacillus daqui]
MEKKKAAKENKNHAKSPKNNMISKEQRPLPQPKDYEEIEY